MDCEAFNRLLDQLLDGALDDARRSQLEAHAGQCPECAAALRAAEQLKALFEEMEPEVDVPLAAQANWRGAVRAEAGRRRRSRLTRWIGTAAAAVVVLVGVGLALNRAAAPKQNAELALMKAGEAPAITGEAYEAAEEAAYGDAAADTRAYAVTNRAPLSAPEAAYEAEEAFDAAVNAVVESDGATAMGTAPEEAAEYEDAEAPDAAETAALGAPAWELSLRVEDVDTACARLCDLAEEYEGTADVQTLAEGGANVFVDLPAGNAGDFLSAVLPMDLSGQDHALPSFPEAGTVRVALAIGQ